MKNILKTAGIFVLLISLILSVSVPVFADEKAGEKAEFYILNRGLNVPAGTDGLSDDSYTHVKNGNGKFFIDDDFSDKGYYNNGESVAAKFKVRPNENHVDLAPGETIVWYVIRKDSNGGWRVDGRIVAGETGCSVFYDGNGADEGNTSDSHRYGKNDTIFIKESAFERKGYAFIGWNTEPDGAGTSYQPGDSVVAGDLLRGSITLYAQWEKEPDLPGADAEKLSVGIVTPKAMSVRLMDGRVLRTGDKFELAVGQEMKFQMCSNNWDNDIYDDNGNGLAGTVVYTVKVSERYDERSYDETTKTFILPKGDPVLRTDVNKCFMAYRYYFEKGDYNKQTGIAHVVNKPLESLSVNLPLGSTITSEAYIAMKKIDTAYVFIETDTDKTISYKDWYWKY